jgi:hypothetical protein
MWKTKGILVVLAIIPFVFLGGGTLHAATGNGEGYFFIDSNEPGGPAFVFEDISGSGMIANIVVFDADDGAVNVDIGFPFLFNGTGVENAPAFTNAVISSNGHLDFFDSPTVDISNRSGDCNWTWNSLDLGIPSLVTDCNGETWGANPFLAVWFGDLNPDKATGLPASDIYYELKGTAPNQRFIVQWETPPFGAGSNCLDPADMLTFQAILYESTNEVLYQYADATTSATCDDGSNPESMGGSATVGLSFTNTTGLEYSANQQVITDGLAIMFGQGEVNLTVDTDAIDFGNVQAGSVANTSVVVTNAGVSSLTITGIGVDDPLAAPYSILSEDCTTSSPLASSATCTIVVEYDPATATAAGGSMFASVGTAGGLFLFGIVAGGKRGRRILAALIVAALLMSGMFLASCGSSSSGGPKTMAFPDSFDIDSDDVVRSEVTVSVNGTTRR